MSTGVRKDQGGEREKAVLPGAQPELRAIWRPSSEFISLNWGVTITMAPWLSEKKISGLMWV